MREAARHPEEAARLATLHSLSLLDESTPEEFAALARLAQRFLRVPIALVSLVDDERQWFLAHEGLDVAETPRADSFCAHAILGQGEVLVVEDAQRDERFAANPLVTGDPRIRFYAGVPLSSAEGLPLGTLCVIDRTPRQLSADERAVLVDLAAVVERELRARQDASLDPLTGVRNRRALLAAAPAVLALADRAEARASLLFIDLDGLKAINDERGHDAGDDAIRACARALVGPARRSDVVARIGGDEFAVLLPGSDEQDAARYLERACTALAAEAAAAGLPLGISAGIAERRPGGLSLDQLLAVADAHLYEARAARRGRTS